MHPTNVRYDNGDAHDSGSSSGTFKTNTGETPSVCMFANAVGNAQVAVETMRTAFPAVINAVHDISPPVADALSAMCNAMFPPDHPRAALEVLASVNPLVANAQNAVHV